MSAGAHHIVHYTVSVANYFPDIPVVILLIVAVILLAASTEELGLLLVAIPFLVAAIIIGLNFPWSHHEQRQRGEMLVNIGHELVWVPAHRLANDTYWPENGRVNK